MSGLIAFELSNSGFPLPRMIGWIHSSKIPTPDNRYTIGNYPRYSNAQWDSLIDQYAVAIQPVLAWGDGISAVGYLRLR